MTENYDHRFDLELGYGQEGEDRVADLLGLAGSTVEVKRKRYTDLKFYVEVAQCPRGSLDYKASGINTTEADYWVYVVADTGVVVLIPRERLKRAAAAAPPAEEKDGDNPTKGRLVDATHLFGVDVEREQAA
jgi:hypothetical protein